MAISGSTAAQSPDQPEIKPFETVVERPNAKPGLVVEYRVDGTAAAHQERVVVQYKEDGELCEKDYPRSAVDVITGAVADATREVLLDE